MPLPSIIYKAVETVNSRGRRYVVRYETTLEGKPCTGVRGRPYESLEAAERKAAELNATVAAIASPCAACPFRRTDTSALPGSARAHAESVIRGAFACCHVNMGPCIGAAMFRANVRAPGRHPDIPDTVDEFLERP